RIEDVVNRVDGGLEAEERHEPGQRQHRRAPSPPPGGREEEDAERDRGDRDPTEIVRQRVGRGDRPGMRRSRGEAQSRDRGQACSQGRAALARDRTGLERRSEAFAHGEDDRSLSYASAVGVSILTSRARPGPVTARRAGRRRPASVRWTKPAAADGWPRGGTMEHERSGSAPLVSQDPAAEMRETVDALYRSESRRVLATLIRLLGDFDRAEEALHDAFTAAVEQWARDGVPANPRAWLVSAGRFKAIDAI